MMTDDASLLEKGVTSSSQPPQPEVDASGPPPPYSPPAKADTFLIVKEPKVTPEWRDLWAAIAFIIHLVVYIGIAFAAIGRGANLGGDVSPEEQRGLSGSLLASCFYSTLIAVLFLLFSRRFATQVIYASGILSIAIVFFFGILCFVYLNVISGLIWLFFAVLMAVIFFFMRRRIPFAAAMLETVVGVIFSFPSLYFASGVGFVILIAWTLLFIYAVSAAVIVWSGGALSFLLIYCTFSYYWTTQVLKNTLHVTSSGLFASYYFFAGTEYFPSNPVLGSFRRAITYSFGSVCFGSLLVALVRTFRFLLRLVLGSHDCLRAIMDCILGIVDRLLRYFNHYAYTEIAIYGVTFCQAGRSVMDLFPVYGLDAVIQDDLIGNVLVIITIICGAGSFGIGYGISLAFTHDVGTAAVFACISLFVGSMVGIVITDIVESGTATTLVCLCEDPRSLQRSKPELYLKLKVAHPSTLLPKKKIS